MGAYAKVRITVTLHPTGNQDGDTYHNDAGYHTQTIPAPVYAAPVYGKVVQQKAALTITKTVIGSGTSSFPFEVLFTDVNGDPVKIPEDTANPKSYEVSSSSPYKVTFTLKDGERVTLQKIPVGTTAVITETQHAESKTSIDMETVDEMKRLGVKQAVIIGGANVVNQNVVNQLNNNGQRDRKSVV